MHRFLRAVGFSNISSKQDMDKLIGISMDKPSVSKQILSGDGRKMTELSQPSAENMTNSAFFTLTIIFRIAAALSSQCALMSP